LVRDIKLFPQKGRDGQTN